MDSFSFLERPLSGDPKPVYVVHGDEDCLKRQVLTALRTFVLGSAEDTLGLSAHPGDTATYAAVRDELETLPFLSPRRLVVVENADPFVTRERARLEKYVGRPAAAGVLGLDVQARPADTPLAKPPGRAAPLVWTAPAARPPAAGGPGDRPPAAPPPPRGGRGGGGGGGCRRPPAATRSSSCATSAAGGWTGCTTGWWRQTWG